MNKFNNFSNNLSYLIDRGIITSKKILEITSHDSNGLVSMWKSGDRQPKVIDVLAIADYLNISMDDLVCSDIRYKVNHKDQLSENKTKEKKKDYLSIYYKLDLENKELIDKLIFKLYRSQKK